jgi:subtilisin family serine protease
MRSVTTVKRSCSLSALALLVSCVAALACPLAGRAASDRSPTVRLAARQLIVRFVAGTPQATADATLARAGLVRLHPAGNRLTVVARASSTGEAARALVSLRRERVVDYAGRDAVAQATTVPNDPDYTALPWPWDVPHFPAAWSSTTGSSVVVAVVDSGVDAGHEDLAGSVLPGYNFLAGNTDTSDDNGHGTEVAGIVAARGDNGIGIAGACWSCKILPVKVLGADGKGTYSNIESGIRWAADHGAQVINLSVGGADADPTLVDAIEYAVGRGAIVVLAAGNSGSTDPGVGTGGYPAHDAPGIAGAVSVGAVDYSGALYSWSNWGSWVELAAAGCFISTSGDGGYGNVCGTSVAAPQVAGLAALLLSADPGASPTQLETELEAHTVAVPGAHTVATGVIDAEADLAGSGSTTVGPPALTAAPALSGTSREGQALSVGQGSWSHADAIGYQWQRSGDDGATWADIPGATSDAYTLAGADVGARVRAAVIASNAAGSTTAASNATATVEAASSAPPPSAGGALPDVTAEISTDSDPILQGNVTYRLRVYARSGSGVARRATVRFTLPAQVQIASFTLDHGRGCTRDGQIFDCDLDWLSPSVSSHLAVSGVVTGGGRLTATATIWAQAEQHVADDTVSLEQVVADPAAPVPTVVAPSGVPVVGGTLTARLPDILSGSAVLRIDWQAYGTARHKKTSSGGGAGSRRWVTVKTAGGYRLKLGSALVGCRLRAVFTIVRFSKVRTLISAETAPVIRQR